MHDDRLEEQLRWALRTEGDELALTISAAELQRRMTVRRRERNGRRLVLAAAAAVAVVAIGSILALTNGWLRLPAVGVDPSPRPAQSDGRATQAPPTSTLGGRGDAIVVRAIADPTSDVQRIEVQLWPLDGDMSVITTFSGILGADPSPDVPPRLSAGGLLAVPLVEPDRTERSAGVAVYDLHEPSRDPNIVTGLGSAGVAWGPDGRLALVDPLRITVINPFDESGRTTVTVPADVIVIAGSDDEIWTNAGDGFLAVRQVGGTSRPGILRLDGTFSDDDSPVVYAPHGTERVYDAEGRQLLVLCQSLDDEGRGIDCGVVAEHLERSGGPTAPWYREDGGARILDHRFDAAGSAAWVLLTRPSADGTTEELELRLAGPSGTIETTTLSDVVADAATSADLAGISTDDGRLVVRLADGSLLLVEPAADRWIPATGMFAGWADQSDAAFPRARP